MYIVFSVLSTDKKSNISIIVPTIDKVDGGPSRSVTQQLIAHSQISPEFQFYLLTGQSPNPVLTSSTKNIRLMFQKTGILGSFFLSRKIIKETALFHAHTLWSIPIHQIASFARKNDVPYIIAPRGMLEPWALQQKKIKKKIYVIDSTV